MNWGVALTAELDSNDAARRPRAVSEDDVTGVNGHVLVDEHDHVGGGEGDGEDGRLHCTDKTDPGSGLKRKENRFLVSFWYIGMH